MARPSRKRKSALGRLNDRIFGRLFCKRSVIIISEHKTQHVPFSVGTQMVGLIVALGFVGWASYSSGSYMAAQQVLVEKDRKLAFTAHENERVEAEFSLLKRDLAKLATEDSKSGKLSDYAKMMSEQLAKEDSQHKEMATSLASTDDKYDAVFKRIDFLENRVKELQNEHEEMISDIRSTTGSKIKELDSIIAATGVDAEPLVHKAEAQQNQQEQQREKYGRSINPKALGTGKGGPLEPVTSSMLKEKETELYFDLKHLMTLHDVVEALPIAQPEAENSYHQTSGFGMRIDPLNGALAFHSGVDLAGPVGAQVKATSEGDISFAGWKSAYGNAVDVDHDYGFTTRYGHLSKILVKEGQHVKRGQVIALQGSTGRSTGNHLHYEVRYNDKPINPIKFLKAGENVRPL